MQVLLVLITVAGPGDCGAYLGLPRVAVDEHMLSSTLRDPEHGADYSLVSAQHMSAQVTMRA